MGSCFGLDGKLITKAFTELKRDPKFGRAARG
jgi:hypothetical protein